MNSILKTARTGALALPFAVFGGVAAAGGLAEPLAAPTPAPVPIAPIPVTGSDWTGFYAGGQLGYGDVEADVIDDDTNGAVFGAHAGYLYDFGSLVLGGELDIDGSNIESDAPAPDGLELDTVTRLKLRAGYDAGDFLPYVTAGVAQAQTSGAIDDSDNGRFAGLGLEYRLSDTLRVGGEVLRHEFEDFADSGNDIDATTAMARVTFQF